MHGGWLLAGSLAFVAVGLYNSWRAWHWREIPEVLEGRERLIPMQSAGIVFFGAFPIAIALDAILGQPANGSGRAIVVGCVGGAIALSGLALGVSTYFFGRPQRLIAPIARNIPRWAPRDPTPGER